MVETTTFGAFVELIKGTDGLLHISNIAPGQRASSVEELLNRRDEIAVRVIEVDRERGRIALRLAEDPEVVGKTVEELASVGAGNGSALSRLVENGRPRSSAGSAGSGWRAISSCEDARLDDDGGSDRGAARAAVADAGGAWDWRRVVAGRSRSRGPDGVVAVVLDVHAGCAGCGAGPDRGRL